MMGAGQVHRRAAWWPSGSAAATSTPTPRWRRPPGARCPSCSPTAGEAAFRAAEAAALAEAVAEHGPVVVSVAGGAVLDPANRALIGRSGTVVWLRADPATLAGRVGDGAGRPLLGDGPGGRSWRRLEAERRPLYAELADAVVDVDDLDPAEVADAGAGRRRAWP